MHHLGRILAAVGVEAEVVGDARKDAFTDVQTAAEASENSLIFLNKPGDQTQAMLVGTPARIVLLERTWGLQNKKSLEGENKTFFLVDDPRHVIGLVLREAYPEEDTYPEGTHATALVHPEAVVPPSVHIGPYCVIGKCRIGERSRILSHTVIGDSVEIGKRVTIREHCMIGSPGFGIARDGATKKLLRVPHVGRALIADDVELFPFVNVDRGTLGDTTIGRGTKVDRYVHVSHNVTIGEDCIVTAQAVFCGSCRIGSRVWIGIGTIVKEGVSVGDDSLTGLGSVVIRDVASGETVAGVPAKPLGRKS
jgi:UDP-3-O-[3-hydroxymyristoyl] glucosamine N-acyltransferase